VWRVGRALATGSLPLDRLARPFGDDPRDRDIEDVPKGLARQLVGFCVVGALSTLFYLLLYSGFRAFTGSQVANALALLVSAVANTAANRRLTFGVRGRGGAVRHQAQGLVVFGIGLALTSGSLAALNAATSEPAHSTELAVLIAANLAATVLRFLLFRAWVFPDRREDDSPVPAPYGTTRYETSRYETAPYDASRYETAPYDAPRYDTAPYDTSRIRAGEAADGTWPDATLQLQPVRPHDTDSRDFR
jgi:putative flippase GtrA